MQIKAKDVRIYIARQYLIAYCIDKDKIVILKVSNQYQDIYTRL